MTIVLNGQTHTLDRSLSVAELLARFGLEPRRVAVEINEQLVRRGEFAERPVQAGDRVEIVTLVGGG